MLCLAIQFTGRRMHTKKSTSSKPRERGGTSRSVVKGKTWKTWGIVNRTWR